MVIQKLKSALNNSLLWLVALAAAVFFFWRKTEGLEDQLKEQKFDDSIKETKDEQAKIDSTAATDYNAYQRVYADYLRQHPPAVQPSGAGPAKADSDKGPTDNSGRGSA